MDQIKEAKQIAFELVRLKDRLGRIGMFKAMQGIDGATNALGYEIADCIEACEHISAKDVARREAAQSR